MVASGPFTVNNELSYEALKDLMAIVRRDKPQALLLCGPFVSQAHEDIQSGDLKYVHDGEADWLDVDQLFEQVINFVYSQLPSKDTQVIVVPSTSEITHMYPIP